MRHRRNLKSPAAHSTAHSHIFRRTVCVDGTSWTPVTLPVVMCAYQPTKNWPIGRMARTRHPSRWEAKFFHYWAGGCTIKSPPIVVFVPQLVLRSYWKACCHNRHTTRPRYGCNLDPGSLDVEGSCADVRWGSAHTCIDLRQ